VQRSAGEGWWLCKIPLDSLVSTSALAAIPLRRASKPSLLLRSFLFISFRITTVLVLPSSTHNIRFTTPLSTLEVDDCGVRMLPLLHGVLRTAHWTCAAAVQAGGLRVCANNCIRSKANHGSNTDFAARSVHFHILRGSHTDCDAECSVAARGTEDGGRRRLCHASLARLRKEGYYVGKRRREIAGAYYDSPNYSLSPHQHVDVRVTTHCTLSTPPLERECYSSKLDSWSSTPT
jgi:hypothetical protein